MKTKEVRVYLGCGACSQFGIVAAVDGLVDVLVDLADRVEKVTLKHFLQGDYLRCRYIGVALLQFL